RIRGHRCRPGPGAAHHPATRRAHLGRRQGGRRRHVLLYSPRGALRHSLNAPAGIAGIPGGPYRRAHATPDPMAAAVALPVPHDPARTRTPPTAGHTLARPGGVRVPHGGARPARDGPDVVRKNPWRNAAASSEIRTILFVA